MYIILTEVVDFWTVTTWINWQECGVFLFTIYGFRNENEDIEIAFRPHKCVDVMFLRHNLEFITDTKFTMLWCQNEDSKLTTEFLGGTKFNSEQNDIIFVMFLCEFRPRIVLEKSIQNMQWQKMIAI